MKCKTYELLLWEFPISIYCETPVDPHITETMEREIADGKGLLQFIILNVHILFNFTLLEMCDLHCDFMKQKTLSTISDVKI